MASKQGQTLNPGPGYSGSVRQEYKQGLDTAVWKWYCQIHHHRQKVLSLAVILLILIKVLFFHQSNTVKQAKKSCFASVTAFLSSVNVWFVVSEVESSSRT